MTYQIDRNGQRYGPYSRTDIERFVGTGNILLTDLAKSDEMAEWQPVAHLLGVSATVAPPPVSDRNAFQTLLYGGPVEPRSKAEFLWFHVAPWKFVVMSLATLGLYHIYWAYQNWNREAARTHEGMMVWARAVFLGIWNFPLFRDIKDSAIDHDVPASWNYILLAILVIVLGASSRLHGLLSLVSLFSFVPYLPVVLAIDRINRKQMAQVEERLNDRLTGWNIALIVVMSILWLLVLAGLLIGANAAK